MSREGVRPAGEIFPEAVSQDTRSRSPTPFAQKEAAVTALILPS